MSFTYHTVYNIFITYYTTTSSNFHVNLPLRLTNVVSLQLSALELPNTFYVISQVFGNNFFVLEINEQIPLSIIIPDGNYDYLALQLYINNFLSTAGFGYSDIEFLADKVSPTDILIEEFESILKNENWNI